MSKFTHIDNSGQPNMVDVSDKKVTTRTAKARTIMILPEDVIQALKSNDFTTKKGPVFHILCTRVWKTDTPMMSPLQCCKSMPSSSN